MDEQWNDSAIQTHCEDNDLIITPQTFFAVCTEGRLLAFDSREAGKVICLWLKNSTQDTF